ncbi:MAG: NHL repeat-containing protein [Planctomycetota bacterium]
MSTSRTAPTLIGLVVALAAAAGVYVAVTLDYRGPERLPTADMDEFAPTDPALVHYREAAAINTGLAAVRGIAVGPHDRIYVAGDSAVRVFDAAGKALSTIKMPAEPRCLAVAKNGTLYVGMLDHVVVYEADGARKPAWPSAGKDAIFASVAVSEENVLVGDAGNFVVLRYDTSGKLVGRIGEKDPRRNIDGFVLPSPYLDVAVGDDDLLRVSNPGRLRVEMYTLDGDPLGHWGKGGPEMDGFQGCCNPVQLAVLGDGAVVTSEKGLPRVKVHTKPGKLRSVVAGPELFLPLRCPTADCTKGKTLDLAADGRGRILALDPSSNTVRIFVRKKRTEQ